MQIASCLVTSDERKCRAGVSGLTTALLLARNETNSVTVVAKHMPGDYDIEYTSPWAGANFMPCVSAAPRESNKKRTDWSRMSLEKDSRWETRSLPAFLQLANEVPEAGIQHQSKLAGSMRNNPG
jgi:D-amino-acid oxidase